MRDAFEFSNAQALATLDSTGVVSTNIWDLEEDAVTDGQVYGWLNVKILSTTNTGGDSGLYIELRSADNTNMSTTPIYLGAALLTQAEIVAGAVVSIGVRKSNCEKYIGVWYKTVSESLTGATAVDAWFSQAPAGELRIQKKPS